MLDAATLRVAFALTALTLLALFLLVTYRSTRTPYSLWWSCALALFLAGSGAYLLDFTPQQVWANPLGNGLFVAGAASVWIGARSLRARPLHWWQFVAPTVVIIVVSAFDSPATNDWSGGPLFLALLSGLIGLSAREILLLDPGYSRTRWPLFLASAALAAYYFVRLIVYLLDGPRGAFFVQYFGTQTTTLITMVLLVVVSFSMASLSGEQLAREMGARMEHTGRELAAAGQVQRRLLPAEAPGVPGYDVAGACVPSGAMSGDFFDWQHTPDGLALTVADVMGKGVGAAMIAATVRAALRVTVPSAGPADAVAAVDQIVETDLVTNEAFVTLLHMRLNATTGVLTVVDAGHGLGLIARADGTRELFRSSNTPLGVLGGQVWTARTYQLCPGDLVLVFSDGVLDLFDGTLDSLSRAADLARSAAPTAQDAVDSIRRLAEGVELPDDVTVVAVRRTA
ncbi:PP2C family protein-serine/threonine phosphatase [Microbacteriaceae bacterium 4G12]